MKILLLPAYSYPEQCASSQLSEDRNKAFVDAGFSMEVYTPMPTRGVTDKEREKYKKKKIEVLEDGKLIIHRFSLFKETSSAMKRALRYFLCCLIQFYKGSIAKDVDLIYVSSTPPIQGAMAALLKKVKKVPFVYNLQDIFPDSLVGTGLAKKNSFLWKIGRKIENFTYRNADKIIVISEDFKRNIMEKGVPEEKIEVVYNWVDEEKISPISREENPLFDELGLSRDGFYIVYAGNMGNAQDIDVILNAAKILKKNDDIRFALFATGGLKEYYVKLANEQGLTNVIFYPLQPIEKVSQVYSLGNAAIISCKRGFGGSAIPSKTWSIMSCGTAVLCCFDEDADLQRIVTENKAGVFVPAGKAQLLVDAIINLSIDPILSLELGANGRNFILNNLTKKIGTDRYVDIMKTFIDK